MKKLMTAVLAACLSIAFAGAYAGEEMKKDAMKKDGMSKGEAKKDDKAKDDEKKGSS